MSNFKSVVRKDLRRTTKLKRDWSLAIGLKKSWWIDINTKIHICSHSRGLWPWISWKTIPLIQKRFHGSPVRRVPCWKRIPMAGHTGRLASLGQIWRARAFFQPSLSHYSNNQKTWLHRRSFKSRQHKKDSKWMSHSSNPSESISMLKSRRWIIVHKMRMLPMLQWEMTERLYCWSSRDKRVRLTLLGSTLIWVCMEMLCMEMLGKRVTGLEGISKLLTNHFWAEGSIRMRESLRCHKGIWSQIWRRRLDPTHSLIDLSDKKLIR